MSRQRQIRRLVLSLLASTALPLTALAAEPSGSAVHVDPAAHASGSGGARLLQAPGDIFQGDVITTDRGGEVQIKFRDDSRFVVGPNSKVTIDEFVFKPDGTAKDVTLAAVRGTFRFIGGKSDSDAYSIHTPTMTLGIRGTVGDFAIRRSGETIVLWQEGSGEACVVPLHAANRAPTECRDLKAGDFVLAPPGGGFRQPRPGEEATLITTFLPYARSPGNLGPGFVVPSNGRPAPAPPPDVNHSQSPYK